MSSDTDKKAPMEFFIGDVLAWSPKSDRHSLEHPFFSLSKKKDLSIFRYTSTDGNITIEVTPSVKGRATIWDKDLLLYVASLIREAINRGDDMSENRPIKVMSANFLQATGRTCGGNNYANLEESLDRMSGSIVKTNIRVGDTVEKEGFSLLSYKIVEKNKALVSFEVRLCDWLHKAIASASDLLTLNRAYFELSKGLSRRIYEMARKHCGAQASWSISVDKLHHKSGSNSNIREFRRMLKEIVKENDLPDYFLSLNEVRGILTVRLRSAKDVLEGLMNS